jgi:carbohydrate-selective porin OprB
VYANSAAQNQEPEPHGNSHSSQKEQHGYSIRDAETHEIKEFGISGQTAKRDATGVVKSPRIAQKLRTKYKGDKSVYGQFEAWLKNRSEAVQWEKDQVQQFKDANEGEKPNRQLRP